MKETNCFVIAIPLHYTWHRLHALDFRNETFFLMTTVVKECKTLWSAYFDYFSDELFCWLAILLGGFSTVWGLAVKTVSIFSTGFNQHSIPNQFRGIFEVEDDLKFSWSNHAIQPILSAVLKSQSSDLGRFLFAMDEHRPTLGTKRRSFSNRSLLYNILCERWVKDRTTSGKEVQNTPQEVVVVFMNALRGTVMACVHNRCSFPSIAMEDTAVKVGASKFPRTPSWCNSWQDWLPDVSYLAGRCGWSSYSGPAVTLTA